MSIRQSTFPDQKWDGLAPTLASRLQDKAADYSIADQHAAEIIAIEAYLKAYVDLLRLIGNPNTIIGVNAAGDGLEYKQLNEGSGVTITHSAGTITFAATGGGGDTSVIAQTNDNASPIVIGQPVYTDVNDHVDLAKADNQATVQILGLVADVSIASGVPGNIQTDGILVATTAQWDAVTGDTGGLDWTQVYYLDPTTPGRLTQTPPSVAGKFVVPVGKAISATELNIKTGVPIKL
jgi:hypothetical protein